MTTKTKTRVQGDTFVLCTFSLFSRGEPYVLDSGNSAGEVCKTIPEHLLTEDETLCLCRVGYWEFDSDEGEMVPCDLTTIFQIEPYDKDALEDEDEEDNDA